MRKIKIINRIRLYLKQYQVLITIKRKLSLRNIFQRKTVIDETFFIDKFLGTTSEYNLRSINFSEGILNTSFLGASYFMNYKPGDQIENTIYTEGNWEGHILKIMNSSLSGSMTSNGGGVVLDIGANIGASSIPLACKFPNIDFFCYEPHPQIFDRLESNIGLNNLKNVYAVNEAVAYTNDKTITFYSQKSSHNMGLSSLTHNYNIDSHDEILVNVANLDNLINKNVLLIKIDTQGSEVGVFKMCSDIIKKCRPVVVFEFEDCYYSNSEKIEAITYLNNFFTGMQYSMFNITKDFDFLPTVYLHENYHGDILCMPKSINS